MAAFWWVDAARARQGPLEDAEFVKLIGAGSVRPETLVWTEGMAQWSAACEVGALSSAFAGQPPATPGQTAHGWPSPPAGAGWTQYQATAQAGASALVSHVDTFPLLGRSLLLLIGGLFVVPAPWTATGFYRYFAETAALPDGGRFRFAGKPGDIWWVFILQGVLGAFGYTKYGMGWSIVVSMCLSFLVLRWFCDKLQLPDGRTLRFEGGFGGFIGWILVYAMSILTLVGWAWVLAWFMDWICRNVRGGPAFAFTGTGLEILWRIVAGILACSFVIPIPWVVAWWMRWFVSQVSVGAPRTA